MSKNQQLKISLLFIVLFCMFFLSVGLSHSIAKERAATIWTICSVNCDFTTVQAAINDSQVIAGDTLRIKEAGPHTEAGILVDKSLTIEGLGIDFTVLQAAESVANSTDRVFNIVDGVDVIIQKMTIRHGQTLNGAFPDLHGGGIRNGSGDLSLFDMMLTDNRSASSGGGLYNAAGAVSIHNSAFESNIAIYAGGGIFSSGSLMLTGTNQSHQAISNEAINGPGGGIYHYGGEFSLADFSIVSNKSKRQGGGLYLNGSQAVIDGARILYNHSGNGNNMNTDFCSGAGIYNKSLLTISGSIINSNTVDDCAGSYRVSGGGIMHSTNLTLTIRNTEVENNKARNWGGGIYSEGPLQIEESWIRNNSRIGTEEFIGSGIAAFGPTLDLKNMFLHENKDGVALFISSFTRDVLLDTIDIWATQNLNGRGGGVQIEGFENTSNIIIRDSTIRENTAVIGGGVIATNHFASDTESPLNITLENSIVVSNTALIDNPSNVLQGQGGGLWLQGTTITITQSLVQGNYAENHGGGMVLNGDGESTSERLRSRTAIVNSTISGNSTLENGGGIYVDDFRISFVSLVHATISNNVADVDGDSGANGGGIYNEGNDLDVNLHNTIIVGNFDPKPQVFSATASDCVGIFNTLNQDVLLDDKSFIGSLGSGGLIIPEKPAPCTVVGDGVQINGLAELDLGPLQNNGGDTLTHALGTNSVAIRAAQIPCTLYEVSTDQRGYARTDQCDIGAYEFDGLMPQPTETPTPVATMAPTSTPVPSGTSTPTPTITATATPQGQTQNLIFLPLVIK